MYVVTGDGLQTIPIRDTASLDLRQVAISGNVLVGLMDNASNGNVAYIPLDN